ncbi:MAG: single-stranded-DNA-specific exonuclease RecJ [Patescibacteria group bacterium]
MKKYTLHKPLDLEVEKLLSNHDPVVRRLLYNRGITTAEEASAFITPQYDTGSHDPYLLKDLDRTVERILKAISTGEKVVIYSDYDTDGIPAAVTLHTFFKKISFSNFYNYIPHRHNEGFGLHKGAVTKFKEEGVGLVITIDCGIADVESVAHAKKLGIDVIITDHHMPGDVMPDAYAIVNPKRSDCNYPEKMLCGAGVIFKVIQAMAKRPEFNLVPGWEKWLLDMVGIATLSDMVPLRGENRVFSYYGLTVLRKSKRPGLVTLLRKLGVSQTNLTEEDIGFSIGPRINAASRMGVPMDAFMMLSTDSDAEARTYVEHLDVINNQRKGAVAQLVKEVKHEMSVRYPGELPKVIVMGNPTWRPSLLGLAANSCAEEFSRPVFLWGRDGDGMLKGSCRSGGMQSVLEIMKNAIEGTFLQFGGHAASGGFAVSLDSVHKLPENLNDAAAKMSHVTKDDVVRVDALLTLDDVNRTMYSHIEKLAPYGVENPRPIFMFHEIVPLSVEQFGKTKEHLKIIARNSKGVPVSAIAFFAKPEDFSFVPQKGKSCTVIGHVEKSVFRGVTELRIRLLDITDKAD